MMPGRELWDHCGEHFQKKHATSFQRTLHLERQQIILNSYVLEEVD
jgi:hypothetical protein